uniref:Ribosomal protein L32 n=1 Tax=Gronococcus sybilensis TaxID=3028029 RepID=A0A9Y1I2E7_9RHOD|nr:ribosomal protein L32 [Gronococcus sybilensis]
MNKVNKEVNKAFSLAKSVTKKKSKSFVYINNKEKNVES